VSSPSQTQTASFLITIHHHHDSNSNCHHCTSHRRRKTLPPLPVTVKGVADENKPPESPIFFFLPPAWPPDGTTSFHASHHYSPKVATTLAPRSVKVADNDAKPYQKRRRPPAVLQGSRTSSHASHTGFGSYATKPYCLASTVIRAAITQPVRTPTRRRQCRQQSLFFSALLFYYGGFVQVQDESDNGGIERRWICWVNQKEQWVIVF